MLDLPPGCIVEYIHIFSQALFKKDFFGNIDNFISIACILGYIFLKTGTVGITPISK